MNPSPYRAHKKPARELPADEVPDGDLLPVILLLWIASAIRVGLGLWQSERFGVEATLALLVVLFAPALMVRGIRAIVSRPWR